MTFTLERDEPITTQTANKKAKRTYRGKAPQPDAPNSCAPVQLELSLQLVDQAEIDLPGRNGHLPGPDVEVADIQPPTAVARPDLHSHAADPPLAADPRYFSTHWMLPSDPLPSEPSSVLGRFCNLIGLRIGPGDEDSAANQEPDPGVPFLDGKGQAVHLWHLPRRSLLGWARRLMNKEKSDSC
ncbi:MAG: hypothetical protein EHM23_36080 [Acidobacteria bacterium]|nr:MAG: hypothetical protein EHM23_36080 [Acidobacteriota bacterium]